MSLANIAPRNGAARGSDHLKRHFVWSEERQEKGLSMKEAYKMMPTVGTRLMRVPAYKVPTEKHVPPQPERCTVIYVNAEHLWYLVKFDRGGWTEGYKAI